MKNLFLLAFTILNLMGCSNGTTKALNDGPSTIQDPVTREDLTLNDLLLITEFNAENYEVSGNCDDFSGYVTVTVGTVTELTPCFLGEYLAVLDISSLEGTLIPVTVKQIIGNSVSKTLINDQVAIARAPTIVDQSLTNGLSIEVLVTCAEVGEVVTFENSSLEPNLQTYTCVGTTPVRVELNFLVGQETSDPNLVMVSSVDINGNETEESTEFNLPIDNVAPRVAVQALSRVSSSDRNQRTFSITVEDENERYPFTVTSDSGTVSSDPCLQSPCDVIVTGADVGTLTLTVDAGAVTDAAQNFNVGAVSARVPVCSTGFVLVPPLDGYTSDNFCVMKYEAKDDGSSGVVSRASGVPRIQNSRDDAIKECQGIGEGYDLITNDEWQTLARNIELVEDNWSETIGTFLSTGHTDMGPFEALEASNDDDMGCINTGQTCDSSTWHGQRRTHTLSNGEVVWDMSGNYSEWVKDDNTVNYGSNITAMHLLTRESHTVSGSLSGGLTTTSRVAKDQFGSTLDYTDSERFPVNTGGFGFGNFNPTDSNGDTFSQITRGSSSLTGNINSGIFSTKLDGPAIVPGVSGIAVRCVYRLSSVN